MSDLIERLAGTFKRAAFDRLMHEDGCPEGEQIKAGLAAVLSSLKPGDVLPGGRVVERGWRPIDEAPKDASWFLAGQMTSYDVVGVAVFHACAARFEMSTDDEPELMFANGNYGPVLYGSTHYRPLPAPPNEGE